MEFNLLAINLTSTKTNLDLSVPLPNLRSTWHKLCLGGVLIPGHITTSFVRETMANFVSATNLIWE